MKHFPFIRQVCNHCC